MGILTQVNMMVLLGYGGYLVIHQQLALGTGLFVFANLLQQFAAQVAQITNIANSIQASLNGAQRVLRSSMRRWKCRKPAQPYLPTAVQGTVRFDQVCFGYQPERVVLQNLDFEIKAGQCVAIVGATGAAKAPCSV